MKKALFLLLTVATLAGCNQENDKSAAQQVRDPLSVTPSPELLDQLKLSAVSTQPVAETLRVSGRIDFDEQRLARIGATVTGRVTDIDALLGQSVKKGEVLAKLNSSELSSQQLAYLKARAELELNRRNAERAKALFEADVIGAAELQRRESEYQISKAETRAASDQLQLLGVGPAAIERLGKQGEVNSVTPVVATLNGVVVERKLAQGQVVQPADSLFVVADLSRLWAVAQVPEQQVSQVKTGQSVSIEVPALGHEKLVGKLIFVGQTIDPETRTVLVRTELDNRDGRLKPAMLASMLIEAKPVNRLVIPAGAVVRENDEDNVFVAEGDGAFRLAKVKLGPEQGGVRVVLSGLKGGEKLVVDGAFHLNNERNRKEMEGS
ncbi:efflux RND transporter periplasmic adaptor subunit [Ferribacterium limneticum]|jgi:cobalt-zinc-cadmium efflux system membrane fusion protein|uniref:efflux RND transporter periplasmic adaptor subunit n=1 Tax=Ferribacterium limneticum TaxID=76259 RepID=UPI001CFB9AED|nr:efflux RND transporter periplasmic adaptor subunit [Ferribacterium limneticum]UCV19311.1 efflux RND transporter periplasmic adaptor subunit [Ferribacterium limneticum]